MTNAESLGVSQFRIVRGLQRSHAVVVLRMCVLPFVHPAQDSWIQVRIVELDKRLSRRLYDTVDTVSMGRVLMDPCFVLVKDRVGTIRSPGIIVGLRKEIKEQVVGDKILVRVKSGKHFEFVQGKGIVVYPDHVV